jgi:hypothetical protein
MAAIYISVRLRYHLGMRGQMDRKILFTMQAKGSEAFVAPLDAAGEWVLVGYPCLQGKEIVLGEVRIVPRAAVVSGDWVPVPGLQRWLLTWSGRRGLRTVVPRGGVTSTLMRARIGETLAGYARRVRAMASQSDAAIVKAVMQQTGTAELLAPEVRAHRAGRKPLAAEQLLEVASAYAAAAAQGSRHPTKDVALKLGLTITTARNRVHRCRTRGVLERDALRVGSGALTTAGRRLWARARRRQSRRMQ